MPSDEIDARISRNWLRSVAASATSTRSSWDADPTECTVITPALDAITCFLEGTLTPLERLLSTVEEHERLRDIRLLVQDAVRPELCQVIERVTGRGVVTCASGFDSRADVVSENFQLGAPADRAGTWRGRVTPLGVCCILERALLITLTSGDWVSIQSPASEPQPFTGAGADQRCRTSVRRTWRRRAAARNRRNRASRAGLAVVSVHGEHDLSTARELTQALEQAVAHSNVVGDLSACSFMDSSVIQAAARRPRRPSRRAESNWRW